MCVHFQKLFHAVRRGYARRYSPLWPYHMIFASTCTKDVLFSGFLTLFFALTLELQRVGTLTKPRLIILVISGMLACLLRNNMIYAMLVWVALLMLLEKASAALPVTR